MTPDELAALTRRPGPGSPSDDHRGRRRRHRDPRRPAADCAIGCCSSASTRRRSASRPATTTRAVSVSTFWRRLMLAGILPPGTDRSRPRTTRSSRPATASPTCSSARRRATRRPTRSCATGVGPLWQKIALWRPAAVVFIYKRAAEIAAGRPLAEPWGQLDGRGAGRSAVLPDAGSVRADRAGRRGAQPAAEPGGVAAGGSTVGRRQAEHERREQQASHAIVRRGECDLAHREPVGDADRRSGHFRPIEITNRIDDRDCRRSPGPARLLARRSTPPSDIASRYAQASVTIRLRTRPMAS